MFKGLFFEVCIAIFSGLFFILSGFLFTFSPFFYTGILLASFFGGIFILSCLSIHLSLAKEEVKDA